MKNNVIHFFEKFYGLIIIFADFGIYFGVISSLFPFPVFDTSNFLNGMDGWQVINEGKYWNVTRIPTFLERPQYALNFSFNDRNDIGSIWIQKQFTSELYNRTIAFQIAFYSNITLDNSTEFILYSGLHPPSGIDDFSNSSVIHLGTLNYINGWKEYLYDRSIKTDNSGTVWLALGFSDRNQFLLSFYLSEIWVELKLP
jgi:hypothetical protein